MKRRIIQAVGLLTALLCLTAALTGCGSAAAAASVSSCTFTFSDGSITAAGEESGYTIDGTTLCITAAGTYTLTGTCGDGSVEVEKGLTGVTLVLDGLDLTAASTAPILCGKESQVTVEVTGDSTLTNGEDAADDGVRDTFEGAAIKVKSGGSLHLTGTAALTVNGDCKNGIKGGAEATVTVSQLTLTVTAANNALASDGGVSVESGTLTLTAGGDGIKAEPDETDSVSAGTVTIQDGTVTIVSGGDGVQSTGELLVTGGQVDITSGGGYAAVLGEDDSAKGLKSDGNITVTGGTLTLDCADDGVHADGDVTVLAGSITVSTGDDGLHADYVLTLGAEDGSGPEVTVLTSQEGLEGAAVNLYGGSGSVTASDDGVNAANADLTGYAYCITVTGGDWQIDAGGDGLDSNGDVRLAGGVVEVFGAENTGNAALDYDGACYAEGGTLLAVGMSGMSQTPTDGLSVSFGATGMGGGMGGGMHGGMGGGQRFAGEAAAGEAAEQPTGQMPELPTGETPTDGGQRPDRGSMGGGQRPTGEAPTGEAPTGEAPTGEMPAGETPTGELPGGGMGAGQDTGISIQAGSVLEIRDSAGTVLYTATGVKNANSVVFASAELTEGETYTLYVDGTVVATAEAAAGSGQTGGPGGFQAAPQTA